LGFYEKHLGALLPSGLLLGCGRYGSGAAFLISIRILGLMVKSFHMKSQITISGFNLKNVASAHYGMGVSTGVALHWQTFGAVNFILSS
jgi:hypothetical protein